MSYFESNTKPDMNVKGHIRLVYYNHSCIKCLLTAFSEELLEMRRYNINNIIMYNFRFINEIFVALH